jgi:hypothetical protein
MLATKEKSMKSRLIIFALTALCCLSLHAQEDVTDGEDPNLPKLQFMLYSHGKVFYQGDSLSWYEFPPLPIFPPLQLKNPRDIARYNKLINNVKRVLPIAQLVRQTMMETYAYLETLPTKQARDAHIRAVEKGIKKQYTPMMKRLTYSQGKLLIKLIDRECNQTSYEIVQAFMGATRAVFYNVFASLFGASLKKGYDPNGDDKLTERVVLGVEAGIL